MPEHHITLTEDDQRLLTRVCGLLGFANVEQAAEWLVKKRLSRVARQTNGRGRALYMLPRPHGSTGGA